MSGRITPAGIATDVGRAGYCACCDQYMPDGPDACLGLIPGVSHACCGHGESAAAYVTLGGEPDSQAWAVNTLTFRGADASDFFALVKRGEVSEGRPDAVWVVENAS